MMLIGVDYHPSFQTIAFFMEETSECSEQELNHGDGQTEKFYRDLKQRGICVRVGMEATGYSRWFERLLAELGFEVWIGDPAEIKTKRVKKQKTDREDARLLLRLMRQDNFPRIWVPDPENRDLRQRLWHRHRLVQMRTRIMNQLQALAINEGLSLEEKTIQRTRASTVREALVSSLGQSAPAGVVGAAGPHESDHRRVNRSRRAGSQEATRGVATDDPSWRGPTYGAGLRADHWNLATFATRQADGQLRGDDSE
jgi:transposase